MLTKHQEQGLSSQIFYKISIKTYQKQKYLQFISKN
jgi:hypothetical protein